jgi:PAS domain S-box-containing protein
LKPIKIIIVEDFHAETESVLRELDDAEFGYTYEVATNENEFRTKLKAFSPDVILSPYSLADTNAVKLLSQANEIGLSAPFILLAFDLSEDIAIELLGEGIEDYVLRSTLKRLPVAIRKALQRLHSTLRLQLSEERLKSSEASMRNMVRNAPIAVAMFDLNMNYLVVSETWLSLESKTEEELLGNNHYDVVPEIPDNWKAVHQRCLKGETLSSENDSMIRADGKQQILRWKMNPWYQSDSVIGGAVLFIEDITDRVLIQLELERSETALITAQSIAKIGSWSLNPSDPTVIWSDELFRIHGIEKQPLNVELIRGLTHTDDLPLFDAGFASLVKGIDTDFIYRIVTPDGKTKHLRGVGKVILDAKNQTQSMSGTVQDISDRVRVQRELEAKTLHRDLILSTAKIGVWYWTVGSDKLKWDDRCAKLFEDFAPELEAEQFYNIIHPDDRETVRKQLVNGLKTGEYSAEYRLLKNGVTTYVLSRGRAILDSDGRATRMDGIIMDMTERHLLESSKKESEQLFRDMAENISEVFWLTDWELNKVLYVSPRYESLYGSSVQELYADSRSWIKNIHPQDLEFVTTQFRLFASTGEYDIEYRLMMKNGSVKWVRDRSYPVLDANGKVVRVAGITEEITDRKLTQEKIETLSLVASETSNGVLIHAADGRITWANRGFTEITGYSEEEIVGKEPWSFLSGTQTNQSLINETYQKMINGETFTSDNILLTKSGEEVWVSTTFNPIMDQTGKLKQIVSIGVDITRQKETEALQKTKLDELEKANQELRKRGR